MSEPYTNRIKRGRELLVRIKKDKQGSLFMAFGTGSKPMTELMCVDHLDILGGAAEDRIANAADLYLQGKLASTIDKWNKS